MASYPISNDFVPSPLPICDISTIINDIELENY